jgi:hypothetical protein
VLCLRYVCQLTESTGQSRELLLVCLPRGPTSSQPVQHRASPFLLHTSRPLDRNAVYFSQHVGIRGFAHSWDDFDNDAEVGFVISYAEDIEEVGWKGIVERIRKVVGENPVYSALHCSPQVYVMRLTTLQYHSTSMFLTPGLLPRE